VCVDATTNRSDTQRGRSVIDGACAALSACAEACAIFEAKNPKKVLQVKFCIMTVHLVSRVKIHSYIVNLSRRPKLCIANGALPDELVSGALTSTCAAIGDSTCVEMRIVDDETFAQNNVLLDKDVQLVDAKFKEPKWNSVSGKLELEVDDRYFAHPGEKSLVNIAIGGCNAERTESTFQTQRSYWESFDQSVHNPIQSNADATTAFGSCDFLAADNFPAGISNAEMFNYLNGTQSSQPDSAMYSTLSTNNKLFGFSSADVPGTNGLFTSPRIIATGAEWSFTAATVSDHGDPSHGTHGFSAKLEITMEQLQLCRHRLCSQVVSTTNKNGHTVYNFKISSTHVSAMRNGDSTFAHYSPICTEREYSLAVSNTVHALGAIQSNTLNNAIHVNAVDYAPIGVCAKLCNRTTARLSPH
jgi:hypothetical protein